MWQNAYVVREKSFLSFSITVGILKASKWTMLYTLSSKRKHILLEFLIVQQQKISGKIKFFKKSDAITGQFPVKPVTLHFKTYSINENFSSTEPEVRTASYVTAVP